MKAAGRDAWLAPPEDPARRSGPWPSGRTWYLASRLLAAIEAVAPGNRELQGAALAGLVGDQALPFLGSIVTVFDFSKCYAAPPIVQPCERVAYQIGGMTAAMNVWSGLVLLGVAVWRLWELWSAVAPEPITDDFLKLLDESFGRRWRRPRSWPWARTGWAYGFTLVGVVLALGAGLLLSSGLSSKLARAPAGHVETSQQFISSRSAGP